MIERLSPRWLSSEGRFPNPYDRLRARGLLAADFFILIYWVAWVILAAGQTFAIGGFRAILSVGSIVTPFAAAAIYVSLRRRRVDIAASLVVALLIAIVTAPVLGQFDGRHPLFATPILLLIPLVASAVLLDRLGVTLTAIAVIVIAAIRAYLQSAVAQPLLIIPADPAASDLAVIIAVVVVALLFPLLFGGSGSRAVGVLQTEMERLRAVTAYVIAAGERRDRSELLTETANTLRDRLGYVVAQIYLLDADGALRRQVRSGPGDTTVVEAARPSPGEADALADAVSRLQTVTFSLGDAHGGHLISPAVASAVIPIISDGVVTCVIDVQSLSDGFSENEIDDLRLLADQFAGALERLAQIGDMRRTLGEQEQITTSLRAQLASLRRTDEAGVLREWTRYFEGRGQSAFGFDIPQGSSVDMPVAADDLPESMIPALESGAVTFVTRGDEQVIDVPIIFRGEVLGAMSFAVPRSQAVTQRQLETARVIGNRLGLALDNTRLFEQSQAQALRERKAGEIASLLISATDVQSVLNLAADSFNQALGAVYTRIYVQPGVMAEPVAGEETT